MRPEKISAFEAGLKAVTDNFRLEASAYYYDYTDLQLNQVVGLTSLITNAAAARIKGVEVEGTWRPETHWTVNGNCWIP